MPLTPSCPRCGYDLSGIAASWQDACPLEGVCSECGLSLRWREVFDPLAGVPSWSIEHAPRWVMLRMPGALLRVLLAPWLWCRLRMSHPIRTSRLCVLAALGLLLPHLLIASYAAWTCAVMQAMTAFPDVARYILTPTAAFSWPYRRLFFTQYDPMISANMWAVAALFLTTPLAFLLLPQTFASLKIRRLHLLRVAAYSLLPLVVWFPALAFLRGLYRTGTYTLFAGLTRGRGWFRFNHLAERTADIAFANTHWVVLAVAAWLFLYWWSAARFYLRLPAPLGAVLGTMGAAGLSAFALVAAWPGSTLLQDVANAVFGMQP